MNRLHSSRLFYFSCVLAGVLTFLGGGASAQSLSWSNHIRGEVVAGPASPGCARAVSAAKSMVTDANGNTYVTGCASNGANDDIVTYKLSPAGVVLWKTTYNGTGDGNDAGLAIALGPDGHVVVTGYSTEQVVFQ